MIAINKEIEAIKDKQLEEIVKNNPNDKELGEKIRNLINNKK